MSRRAILLIVVVLLAIGTVPVPPALAAACTRVIGGSQTSDWYHDGQFEQLVVDAEWERQTNGGQSIITWGVGGSGWDIRIGSACTPTGTLPTRLVIHVLPGHADTSVEGLSGQIADAIAAVPIELPSVTDITLIPPVHGEGCDNTLSLVQPQTVEAINQNLSATVDAGPVVVVPDCSMFKDPVGHLTKDGAQYAAEQYAEGLDTPSGPPDVTPPQASILEPTAGATVSGPVSVTMEASDDVAIGRVELHVDGALAVTDTTSPYQVTWDSTTVTNGTHTLTAVAFDTGGNSATSAPVEVTTDNEDVEPPQGQFTASPTTVGVGSSVTFTDAHTGGHRRVYSFGDGVTKKLKSATTTHTYTAAGVYTASLETFDLDTGLRATFTLTITVTA